jgi:hypothetical protein
MLGAKGHGDEAPEVWYFIEGTESIIRPWLESKWEAA